MFSFSRKKNQMQQQAQMATSTDWVQRYRELARQTQDPRLKRFYEAGIVSAATPIQEVPLLALDFETTGLNPKQHAIVSLACLPMTLERIQLGAAQAWLAKPRRPLLESSVVVHGITHSQIKTAPDLNDIFADLLVAMAGRVMVVHYHEIERPFLNQAFFNRIGEGIEFPVIDTMALEARQHCSKLKQTNSLWRRLYGRHWQQKQVSLRLADVRARYNLPWYKPHDAVLDALGAAELLQAQVAHHYSPTTAVGRLWQ